MSYQRQAAKIIGLTENVQPLRVIETTKPVKILECPHCRTEIHEKHIYEERGTTYHSDCQKPILMPEPSAEEKAWLASLSRTLTGR